MILLDMPTSIERNEDFLLADAHSMSTCYKPHACPLCYVSRIDGCSSDCAPCAGHQDSTLHSLDQRHGLVHSLAPPLNVPALLTAHLTLFQIGELPEVMHSV